MVDLSKGPVKSDWDGPYSSRAEWERQGGPLALRTTYDELDATEFRRVGFCTVCSAYQEMSFLPAQATATYGALGLCWSATGACLQCHVPSRGRAAIEFMEAGCPKALSAIYATEYLSNTSRALKSRYPEAQGSEYFGQEQAPGSFVPNVRFFDTRLGVDQIVPGVRHEDVSSLSFESQSFDGVLILEVLEHVEHLEVSLWELHRVLRAGGLAVITVPFYPLLDETRERVRRVGGRLFFTEPPEYHGDPIRERGSLVWRMFGWSLLEDLASVGFLDAGIWVFSGLTSGHIGSGFLIAARKSST